MWIEVYRRNEEDMAELLVTATTNADGGTDDFLITNPMMTVGTYRLVFHIGDYFENIGTICANQFLTKIPIEFAVRDADDDQMIQLFVAPWSYSVFSAK